jgi:hypothetical protein
LPANAAAMNAAAIVAAPPGNGSTVWFAWM